VQLERPGTLRFFNLSLFFEAIVERNSNHFKINSKAKKEEPGGSSFSFLVPKLLLSSQNIQGQRANKNQSESPCLCFNIGMNRLASLAIIIKNSMPITK
jgi:hypothetical protein